MVFGPRAAKKNSVHHRDPGHRGWAARSTTAAGSTWGALSMRVMRAAAFWAFLALLAGPAAAWDTTVEPTPQSGLIYDMKIGALQHDPSITGNRKEPFTTDLNLEVMFSPSLPILFGTVRPALGATINFAGFTSKAYLDARWQVECCWGAFFALGIGAAIHNGEEDSLATAQNHKQLGYRVLFHPNLEWGYRFTEHHSLSIFFEHISNANTASKNEGLDNLGLRYGYRF
jgi:lipid A 3-O-deacylase